MANLDYLFIHATATPEGRRVTKGDLDEWHLAPRDLKGGRVRYKGRNYESREDLPDEKLNGKYIENLHGRGWRAYGYSDKLDADGTLENLTPFNQDSEVDPWEVTNGAVGFNGRSRHFVYVGGLREEIIDDHWEPADTRTPQQLYAMEVYVRYMVLRHPNIKVAGHNAVSRKACPCFDVAKWCKEIGIPEKNIYNG